MDWDSATLWWLAAGALVAVELATGTFYLLMLALGCTAAALAAHAGMSSTAQWVAAALVGGGATALWHRSRLHAPHAAPAESNRDVNLDIGQTVHVAAWADDGTARVQYRGAAWDVRFQGSGVPAAGDYTIRALDGNCLLVDR